MDVTTIQCGKETRNNLKSYKEDNGLDNYDEAIRSLLAAVDGGDSHE